jgi:hypothetical protein
VALGGTGVGEAFTLYGDKLPIVALGVQGEVEHPVGLVVVYLCVGDRVGDLIEAPAPEPTTNCLMPSSGSALPSGS